MTIETPKRNISAIQSLRGIAAMMVVLHHLQNQTSRLGLPTFDMNALQAGVDIFFVISGFIMWITTAERPERTAGGFLRDRAIRIVPLYWIIISAIVILLLMDPRLFTSSVWEPSHIIASFVFIAHEHPGTGLFHPILIPGWTLNLEMFFYIIFAIAIAFGGIGTGKRATIIIALIAALAVVGFVVPEESVISFYTSDILLEFGAGVLLGITYLRGLRPHPLISSLMIGGGFAALLLSGIFPIGSLRSLAWGIPATLIVAGAVFGSSTTPRPLALLGDWSYSLYLTHPLTLAACEKMWATWLRSWPAEMFPLLAIIACVLVSAMTFRYVEMPATTVVRRAMHLVGRRPAGV